MKRGLFIGFKGKNNASGILVSALSPQHCLLTNSFQGLKKDIERLSFDHDEVYLFGVDKNLSDSFRIERFAEKDDMRTSSELDLERIAECFASFGIKSVISDVPTQYLCNEAYQYLMEKYKGNVVLIHIPTVKNFREEWISGIKMAIEELKLFA